MAPLKFARGYFRTAKYLPPGLSAARNATLRSIETAPTLPGPEDVPANIPPVRSAWRRRIGASAWWVYFVVGADGSATVVAVAVPRE